MSKMAPSYEMPLDQPIEIAPGITQRMTDWQGSAKFGFVQSQGGTPEGRRKGDRGWADLDISMPRRAVPSGTPFANMRKL